MRVLVLLVLMGTLMGACRGGFFWERVSPAPGSPMPLARRDAAFEFDANRNRLVLFGGTTSAGDTNDCWVFDLATQVWTELTPANAPDARHDMVSGVLGDVLYIATGFRKPRVFQDIWALDLANPVSWTQLPNTGSVPPRRYGSAGGIYWSNDTRGLYVSHGFSKFERHDDTFFYDLTRRTWDKATPTGGKLLPPRRCLVGTAMSGPDSFAMFGGCGSGGYSACPSHDTYLYSRTGGSATWAKVPDCAPARQRATMAAAPGSGGRELILYGGKPLKADGSKPTAGGIIDVLNADTGRWRRVRPGLAPGTDAPPTPRVGMQMALVRRTDPLAEATYVFGGGAFSAELWRLGVDASTPNSAVACKTYLNAKAAHGVLQMAAWGVLLPGAGVAGFEGFLRVHGVLLAAGTAIGLAGFGSAFAVTDSLFTSLPHAPLGALLTLLLLVECVLSVLCYFGKLGRRMRLAYLALGCFLLVGGALNVALGIWHLNRYSFASLVWLNAIVGIWGCIVAALAALVVVRYWRRPAQHTDVGSVSPVSSEGCEADSMKAGAKMESVESSET